MDDRNAGVGSAVPLVNDPGSIADLASAIGRGTVSIADVLGQCLRRIEAVEPQVQGWCVVDRECALAQADVLGAARRAGTLRGPLHGMPIAVKDVIDVAGLPTRAGSATRAQAPTATIDAQIVTQLRAAGAIVLGKAHTTEFAYFAGRRRRAIRRTSRTRRAGRAPARPRSSPPAWFRSASAHRPPGRSAGPPPIAGSPPSSRARAPGRDSASCRSPQLRYRRRLRLSRGRCGRRRASAHAGLSARPHPARPDQDRPYRGCDPGELKRRGRPIDRDRCRETTGHQRRVQRRSTTIPFTDIIAWHKTITEYELARAHPALAGERE